MTGDELTALARRAQTGDAEARDELLVALYRDVRKHVYFTVGPEAMADEVVQETMIAVDRGLGKFRGDIASPRTWALRIATRTAWRMRSEEDRYRAMVPMDEGSDVAVFDPAPAAAAELVMLQRALAALSPKKRDSFVLMAIFELTAEEAGQVLGTSANTAASRNRHARDELEAFVKKFDELEGIGTTVATKAGKL
jgi:RNA polymerase sigma-70 factor (ECF subfamily)